MSSPRRPLSVFQNMRHEAAEGYEMTFGSKVSLSAALEAVEKNREYVSLSELEADLPEYMRQAKARAREQYLGSLSVRGYALDKQDIPSGLIDSVAAGMLLGLVSRGEQAALSSLLYGKK